MPDAVETGELVAGALSGIAGVGGWLASRRRGKDKEARRTAQTIDELAETVDEYRQKLDAAMTYIFDLHMTLREEGMRPPKLPPELTVRPVRTRRRNHDDEEGDDDA